MKNGQYLLALHTVDGLGTIRLKNLIDRFKDPKLAWEADLREIREVGVPQAAIDLLAQTRKKLDPDQMILDLEKLGIKWLNIFDENYPKLLKQIYDPPIVFYYKGEFRPEDSRAIAVVGTRKITGYGKMVTEKFVDGLVSAGLTIVSGLARGVDSVAHKSALDAGGRTIAVLGGGLNKIFPPENTRLANEIASGHGVVMSEFPPDYPSVAGNFPARNRIISGLSLATLVTEAASDSGSLITARLALEQGRDVFAIPGPITSQFSRGPADLIKEGARLVMEAGEILEELGMSGVLGKSGNNVAQITNELSEEERQILDFLHNEQKHIDDIGRSLNFDAAKISAALLKMEIQGLVRNLGGGVYCANMIIA